MDTVTNEEVPGNIMCPSDPMNTACQPGCLPVQNSTYEFSGFCYGDGSSMDMLGFEGIAISPTGSTPCVNLLFPDWTLDTSVKFGFACFGVVLFGIFIQFLTKHRREIAKRKKTWKVGVYTLWIYSVQIVSSYLIMLITMTYNVELFVCVCLGLIIGYGIFNLEIVQESVEPCCAVVDDEDDNAVTTNSMTQQYYVQIPGKNTNA
jgi:hypothetical protein